jgi:uncharacterized protein YaaQ
LQEPRILVQSLCEQEMAPRRSGDQLAIVTVSAAQAGPLTDALTQERYCVTQVDSDGGVLSEPTVSLFIGLEQGRLRHLLELVRSRCPSRRRLMPAHAETPLVEVQPMMVEVEVGGATVFVLDVERFEQL